MKESGGDARHHCSVVSILLDAKGRATGVAYEDRTGGRSEALAPIVFAGAAPAVLAEMLPEDKRETFAHQFTKFEPSISLFNVSLGLSRPAAEFGVSAYSTFTYPDDVTRYSDFPRTAAIFGHEPSGAMPPYVIADYGRLDAGLRQPQDLHLVSLRGVDRLAWWDGLDEAAETARRTRWIDALVADVDRRYPGFASAVSQAQIATARTMKTRLATPSGEVYGFSSDPVAAVRTAAQRRYVDRRPVDQFCLHGVGRLFRRNARRAHGRGRRMIALRCATSLDHAGADAYQYPSSLSGRGVRTALAITLQIQGITPTDATPRNQGVAL